MTLVKLIALFSFRKNGRDVRITLVFLALSAISTGATAGESFGCIWAKAKLETAIEMQEKNSEKQRYYKKENGEESLRYELAIESAREDEREARAEVSRKCD